MDPAAGHIDGALDPHSLRRPSHYCSRREEERSHQIYPSENMNISPMHLNPWSTRKSTSDQPALDKLDCSPRGILTRLNAVDDAIREGLVIESLGQRARRIVDEGRAKGLVKQAPSELFEEEAPPPGHEGFHSVAVPSAVLTPGCSYENSDLFRGAQS